MTIRLENANIIELTAKRIAASKTAKGNKKVVDKDITTWYYFQADSRDRDVPQRTAKNNFKKLLTSTWVCDKI